MTTIDRRQILVAWAVACAGLAAPRSSYAAGTAAADAQPPAGAPAEPEAPKGPSPQYEEALARILGGKEPKEERVTVDIPETVENGNIVPYKLDVEGDVSLEFGANETIERLYLLSTLNPQALVGTFHFTPLSGKPAVTGRMRLAKTQEVVALAETSKGEFLIGRRKVEVGIPGCASE